MPKKTQKKKKGKPQTKTPEPHTKDFLDLIAPSAVKFNTDHYICGSAYHCTLALRSYPTTTEELALLRHLGEKSGVTLSIYTRQVSATEEDKIIHNAENKNRMDRSSTNNMKQTVTAEAKLGLVDSDIFISQSNELNHQLQAAKQEKERLVGGRDDDTILKTKEMMETLELMPAYLAAFDREIFEELVEKVTANSNALCFRLKNGLELTEHIERTVR